MQGFQLVSPGGRDGDGDRGEGALAGGFYADGLLVEARGVALEDLDDGGLEITESVVVTPNGYESLASVEQRLLVK